MAKFAPGLIKPRRKGTEKAFSTPMQAELAYAQHGIRTHESAAFTSIRAKKDPTIIQASLAAAQKWEDVLFAKTKEFLSCAFS